MLLGSASQINESRKKGQQVETHVNWFTSVKGSTSDQAGAQKIVAQQLCKSGGGSEVLSDAGTLRPLFSVFQSRARLLLRSKFSHSSCNSAVIAFASHYSKPGKTAPPEKSNAGTTPG